MRGRTESVDGYDLVLGCAAFADVVYSVQARDWPAAYAAQAEARDYGVIVSSTVRRWELDRETAMIVVACGCLSVAAQCCGAEELQQYADDELSGYGITVSWIPDAGGPADAR